MNSLFLNFVWTPVKHYLLLIKSPQLVLILASTPPINGQLSSAQHRPTPLSRAPSIASFHSCASVPCTTSAAPTSHSGSAVSFCLSPSFENSHVPRRSSQVPRPVS